MNKSYEDIISNLKEENVKSIYEFENFEFLEPSKQGLGLGENNVTVVEKEIELENGEKVSIFEFYKDNELIASTNEKGELNFSEEYKKQLKSSSKDYYDLLNLEERDPRIVTKEDLEKKLEQEEKGLEEEDGKEKKAPENITKEAIQKELGDKYIVSAEVNDPEISDKLSRTDGIIGNPLMAFNKEKKEFVLIGKNQNGKLIESEMLRTSEIVPVRKYSNDGKVVEETAITGMIFLPPQNEDALSIEMNEYGEVEINKVVNARSEEPALFPVETRQTNPTTMEIEEMKQNGDKLQEVMQIIDELQEENIIDGVEADNLKQKVSKNGQNIDEDIAMIEEFAEKKREEKEQNTIEDDDDGLPPMADPYNPLRRSRW